MPPPRALDILSFWRSKGDITPEDESTGIRIRQIYERSGMTGHATIYSSSTQGRSWASRSGRQQETVEHHEALGRMRAHLGMIDNTLVIEVIAKERPLSDLDEDWKWAGGKEHVAKRVRVALRVLGVKRWGTPLEVMEWGETTADALANSFRKIY